MPFPMAQNSPAYTLEQSARGVLRLELHGDWTLENTPPQADQVISALDPETARLTVNGEGLGRWDTSLLLFLQQLAVKTRHLPLALTEEQLPAGALSLLRLAEKSGRKPPEAGETPRNILYRTGMLAMSACKSARDMATFLGEITLESARLFSGKSRFRWNDFWSFVQATGVESLPVVSLIAILAGVILSFVGAVQLRLFGAEIYIANLVTLGMVMEMGALMSSVIVAGRIGAAYAAQLGAMQVNEETDALRTMGISPVCFLVLPRLFALALMMPFLCVYSDLMGILGGIFIGHTVLGLRPGEFLHQAVQSVSLWHCLQGLTKSAVFGLVIGFSGCLRGMGCGRSAMAVGEATTSAVVTAIVLIVISDSILTIFFNVL